MIEIVWTKKEATRRSPLVCEPDRCQAALSHIDVSKALLIIGMFMPKLAFAAAFDALFGAGFSLMLGATSVARSHDPFS